MQVLSSLYQTNRSYICCIKIDHISFCWWNAICAIHRTRNCLPRKAYGVALGGNLIVFSIGNSCLLDWGLPLMVSCMTWRSLAAAARLVEGTNYGQIGATNWRVEPVSHWGLFRNSTQEASVESEESLMIHELNEWHKSDINDAFKKLNKWTLENIKTWNVFVRSFFKLATWRSLFRRWCAPQLCWLATEPIFCRKSMGFAAVWIFGRTALNGFDDWPNKRRHK